ncbi:MAG: glutaminyl-peptide cyclotransferase [Deltaproteobacteria bacterium]|jgi:glutamine cyclotransferase|nr:glutaminyl-peptide cyclotransferase [Deltaproteobacteria bacterium]
MRIPKRLALTILLLALWLAPAGADEPAPAAGPPRGLAFTPSAPIVPVTMEKEVERPQGMFTQGLVFFGPRLYESTGLYQKSALHTYPATELGLKGGLGTEAQLNLPPEVFAEGLAEAGGDLYLLTWQEGLVFIVDPSTLTVKETIRQPMEGWGLAHDGRFLWRSDGSDRLQKHQPGDFAPTGDPLSVRDGQNPVRQLNELEWDARSGLMLANLWHSDLVAAIDLASGQVRYYLDLGPIAAKERARAQGSPAEAVANGLAIDGQGRLWVTGKLWPSVYQISYPAPQ